MCQDQPAGRSHNIELKIIFWNGVRVQIFGKSGYFTGISVHIKRICSH
jgi:hypothetical protein